MDYVISWNTYISKMSRFRIKANECWLAHFFPCHICCLFFNLIIAVFENVLIKYNLSIVKIDYSSVSYNLEFNIEKLNTYFCGKVRLIWMYTFLDLMIQLVWFAMKFYVSTLNYDNVGAVKGLLSLMIMNFFLK